MYQWNIRSRVWDEKKNDRTDARRMRNKIEKMFTSQINLHGGKYMLLFYWVIFTFRRIVADKNSSMIICQLVDSI